MTAFILPLSDPAATDPERVGPKAANLAALTQAGLPTPGGFALTAEAYRHQARHIGIDKMLAEYNATDIPTSRRMSIAIRWRSTRSRSRRKFSNRFWRRGARKLRNFRKVWCAPRR